jgi:hypothetical protein
VSNDLPSWAPEVGVAGVPFDFVVEAGKVAEFAAAVGADPALGVPPTLLEAARFARHPGSVPWFPEGELYGRTLHGSQEFEFPAGPLAVGSRLVGQMRVEKVFTKTGARSGKLVFIEIATSFDDGEGRVVAISRQTMVVTERAPEGVDG